MKKLFGLLLVGSATLFSCHSSKQTNSSSLPNKTLRSAWGSYFLMGTALNTDQIAERNPEENKLILREFNAVTPENIMKAEVLQPRWNEFDFTWADKLVDWGKKNDVIINAHTLIWHSQLPEFARKINDRDSFRFFFENHIRTVASRYQGKVHSWDVVNEALNEDGTLRKSPFLNKLGEGYLVDAFRLTAEASPNTELYYNDYNNEQPQKRAGCIALIKRIQDAGVRIDGVGIQGHWQVGKVPFDAIEKSIQAYAALGIKVMFTELDIDVLPRSNSGADVDQRAENRTNANPYVQGLPDSVSAQLARDFKQLFALFHRYRSNISRVTFWGVHDGQSWLNDWPIRGRTNHGLIFDRQLKPKQAYFDILQVLNKGTQP